MRKSPKVLRKNLLFELLEVFGQAERNDLIVFAGMPVHKLSTRDKEILAFIFEKLDSRRAITEVLVRERFGIRETDKDRISWNHTKNRLLSMMRKYIRMQEVNKNPFISNYILSKYFFTMRLDKNYRSSMEKGRKMLEKKDLVDRNLFYHRYQWHELKVTEHAILRKEGENLRYMEEALDQFFLENKLRCLNVKNNRKWVYNTEVEDTLFLEAIETVAPENKSRGIFIHYNLYKLLTEEDNEGYFTTVDSLIRNEKIHFNPAYFEEVVGQLMNYCLRRISRGDRNYAVRYIDYISLLYEKKLLLEDEKISNSMFRNVISIALYADRIDWAKDAINKFGHYLEKQHRDDILNFSKAHIAFCENDYNTALECLNNFQFPDLYFDISYRKLYIRIQYHFMQEGMYERDNFIRKIKHDISYIQRHKRLISLKKEQIVLFFKTLLKIVNGKKVDLLKIKDKFLYVDYQWLEKISMGNDNHI